MSVTVKAYLLGKDEQVKEIRRFTVDQDVSCSFEYLSRKVAAVFSNLSGSTCSLFYKGEPRTATSALRSTPSSTPSSPAHISDITSAAASCSPLAFSLLAFNQ
uniref:Uncharacterized protein n=1 Tax=Poecilia latipinna TaxID=48699 RepID=A0A3B3TFP1_9TELE